MPVALIFCDAHTTIGARANLPHLWTHSTTQRRLNRSIALLISTVTRGAARASLNCAHRALVVSTSSNTVTEYSTDTEVAVVRHGDRHGVVDRGIIGLLCAWWHTAHEVHLLRTRHRLWRVRGGGQREGSRDHPGGTLGGTSAVLRDHHLVTATEEDVGNTVAVDVLTAVQQRAYHATTGRAAEDRQGGVRGGVHGAVRLAVCPYTMYTLLLTATPPTRKSATPSPLMSPAGAAICRVTGAEPTTGKP